MNGRVAFDNFNIDTDLSAKIGNLPLSVKGRVRNEIADLFLDIPKLNPNFLISEEQTRSKQYLPYISVKGKYWGNISKIDYDKLNIKASILGSIPSSKIKYEQGGMLNLANNKIQIKGVKGYLNNVQNTFLVDANINEAFGPQPDVSGNLKIKTPNLSLFNEILVSDIVPDGLRNYTKDYEFKEGGINVNGVELNNITIHQIRKLIAWIPQELALPMEWVRDMVQLPFTLKANRATSFNESVLFAKFEELGLENELYDKRVNEISGGQRQRMMIAVASMLNKSLILADEPTSALDVESSIMVRNFFLRQAQKGCAILAISHDANFSCGCHKRLIMGDTQSIILRDNM